MFFVEEIESVCVCIREWLRQAELGPLSRTQLLKLLELRCQAWQFDSHTFQYYTNKIPSMAVKQVVPSFTIAVTLVRAVALKIMGRGTIWPEHFMIPPTIQFHYHPLSLPHN